jgi:curli biogenesis system outer membrane secretion channel CsgG
MKKRQRLVEMHKITNIIFYIFFIFFLHSTAHAKVVESVSTAQGIGVTRDKAIHAALLEATAQAFGFQMAATIMTSISSSDKTTNAGNENNYIAVLNKEISQRIKSPTNSPILGYTVVNTNKVSEASWEATVELKYAKLEQIGGNSDRRSMVVVASDKKYDRLLKDSIEQALTASRRFDVLNRDDQSFFDQEKAFITSSDAGKAEVARLGQALGSDYLVIIKFPNLSISNDVRETIRMTGEVLVQSSVSGSVKIEVIEFSSRKLKWSGSEKFSATYKGASSVGTGNLTKLVDGASSKLVDNLIDAIYPIRVVKVMNKNTAAINRGRDVVKNGQKFGVFMMGEELIDPQSGESLGALELEIGQSKVISTTPKYSVIKLNDGEFDAGSEYIVRLNQ